jgi:hypothetical protein
MYSKYFVALEIKTLAIKTDAIIQIATKVFQINVCKNTDIN